MKKHAMQSDLPLLRNDFNERDYVDLIKKDFITKWNKEINGLRSKKEIRGQLEWLFDHNDTLSVQKNLLYRIVSSIDGLNEEKCVLSSSKMIPLFHHIIIDDYVQKNTKVDLLGDLSILELSLVIAIKHHNDIYDGDPFNFEIILTRLQKFQNSGEGRTGAIDRAVVLKAFDVLKVNYSSSNDYKII